MIKFRSRRRIWSVSHRQISLPISTAALQPGSNISGHVTAAGGAAIKNVSVQVYDSTGERVADGRTNAAGVYNTAPALPSGSYRIGFFPRSDDAGRYLDQFYNDKTTLALSDPITLAAPTPAIDINAVLAQGGAITGRVTAAENGAGLANVAVSIYNAAGDAIGYANTGIDGVYSTQRCQVATTACASIRRATVAPT